jgi:hypothetical protein
MSNKLTDTCQFTVPKPVKLELNNSGSWKTLGTFDAGDQAHAELVMDAAVTLVVALHNGGPDKRCPTMRIATDDGLSEGLMYWKLYEGWKARGQA